MEIKDTLIYGIELIIFENILKSEILIKYNIRDKSIKYYKYFNIINKDIKG